MRVLEQFIKELTDLSLKYKIMLHGDGMYSHFIATQYDDLKGKYVIVDEDTSEERISWWFNND